VVFLGRFLVDHRTCLVGFKPFISNKIVREVTSCPTPRWVASVTFEQLSKKATWAFRIGTARNGGWPMRPSD
jgi:hypothetical protein